MLGSDRFMVEKAEVPPTKMKSWSLETGPTNMGCTVLITCRPDPFPLSSAAGFNRLCFCCL